MIPTPMSLAADLREIKRRLTDLESAPDLSGAKISFSAVEAATFRTSPGGLDTPGIAVGFAEANTISPQTMYFRTAIGRPS